jgi:hypothetical protein
VRVSTRLNRTNGDKCQCLLFNIVHGLVHRELGVGLAPLDSIFVILVMLIFSLIGAGIIWTAAKRLGLVLLSLSMFGSLLFGLYHHFMAVSPDHIHSQPSGGWGTTFVLTAYLLLITEATGAYIGVHFLWIAKGSSDKAVKA